MAEEVEIRLTGEERAALLHALGFVQEQHSLLPTRGRQYAWESVRRKVVAAGLANREAVQK